MKRHASISEAAIQKAILDYLAAEHILAFRMNVGVAQAEGRHIVFGVKGMADILSFPKCKSCRTRDEQGLCSWCNKLPSVLWIEVKTARGSQSPFQRSFEEKVTQHGQKYIIARSLDDVIAVIG